MAALTHFPKLRITELVGRFGGVSRDEAIAQAKQELAAMRGEGNDVIEASIKALEVIVFAPAERNRYSADQLKQILVLCDQIVTLAGTFEYIALDQTTRSLCDVADGLMRTKKADIASIHVHMRAMQMVNPKAPPLGEEQIKMMLAELRKILAHHGFDQLSASADKISFEDVPAAPD
jgi:hypothetical protein